MIGTVLEKQCLSLENVLVYRGELTPQSSIELLNKLDLVLQQNGAQKSGGTITVTHDVRVENGQQVINLEMLIPLDKAIVPTDGFSFLPIYMVKNALKVSVIGNPQQLEAAMQKIAEHMNENSLTPNTPPYIHTLKEEKNALEFEDMITEIYVGVNQ